MCLSDRQPGVIFVSVPYGSGRERDWRTGVVPSPISPRAAEEFVNRICREIGLRAQELSRITAGGSLCSGQALPVSDLRFGGIYFGGSGPSLLSLDQLYRILQAVCDNLSVDIEEQRLVVLPGSVQEGKAKVLRESGFDRAELRVRVGQHYSDDFEVLRAAGFASVGFEVGYSAEPDWERWLGRLLELGPDTVIFYAPEGSAPDRLLTAVRTARRLIGGSLRQFLLHHYCRSGKESGLLANLLDGEVVGFGPGAMTIIRGRRQQNEVDPRRYLRRLGRGDIRRAMVSLTFVDLLLGRLLRREGIAAEDISTGALARLVNAGLLVPEAGRLQLSEKGSVAMQQVRQLLMEGI